MVKTVFIAGTDTEIGKTHVACGVIRAAREQGLRVAPFKPVAAGCEMTPDGPRNSDALALYEAAESTQDYSLINPYAFRDPIAPHLAAADENTTISLDHIADCYRQLSENVDLVVVEGAGGWAVPLGENIDFPALVERQNWPVLLVVGMRLGCLNHALLSAESIARTAHLTGWVANCLPPEQRRLDDNISSLQQRLPAPWLGSVRGQTPVQRALRFDALYAAL